MIVSPFRPPAGPHEAGLLRLHGKVGDGNIALAACSGAPSQLWNLTGDPAVVTDVQSMTGSGGCWEINSCGGSSIDTDYGCKKLPTGSPPWTGARPIQTSKSGR